MVHELLGTGKEAAIPGRDLANLLGLHDLRVLTALVERERGLGYNICATTNAKHPGYFIAGSPEELATYMRSLNRRIHNTTNTYRNMETNYMAMTGQQQVEGW